MKKAVDFAGTVVWNLVKMPLAAGTKLGDYDVVEMIGAAGLAKFGEMIID